MSDSRHPDHGSRVPEAGGHDRNGGRRTGSDPSSPVRRVEGSPAPAGDQGHHSEAEALPRPEFLSLTYTLPYHLLERVDQIAEASLRSRSEVVSDALRLYVRTWQARERHTRISTVDGFSYQEVEVSSAWVDHGGGAATIDPPPPPAPQRDSAPEEIEIQVEPAPTRPQAQEPTPERANEPESPARSEPTVAAEPTPGGDVEPPTEDVTTPGPERKPEPERKVEIESGAKPIVGPEPKPAAKSDPRPEPNPEPEPTAKADLASAPGVAASGDRPAGAADEQALHDRERSGSRPQLAIESGPEKPEVESVSSAGDDPVDKEASEEQPATVEAISDPAAWARADLKAVASESISSMRLRKTLAAIVAKVDVRDASPDDHSEVVASMARELAEEVGLVGAELRNVELAGLVHDIGKACIPDEILIKRRPSPEEMSIIRKYPDFGAELLGLVPALAPLVPIVASHQERWNGNGYPDGLQGGDIPTAAQIVALCDVYQVLIHDRHYRPAYPEERALQIIRQNVGTLWNPDIARKFLKMLSRSERR